ncbi:unnamed protein product [Clonostachys rhizophaga]|uniref:C2H2-type domain-containing protein n=1 Tax=Clonostachys rhizophaga TaxID=160324 RepID=A0A9N9VMY0_9HYPO|nr:unnamed protein product [Clonostachys rhizophaga]
MDAMHYPQDHYNSNYGYGPSSSYSDPASRAYSTVPTASAPVKYTPVTGRVSRAKKGYPVHLANNGILSPDCRRHQLSHNPPEQVCSVPGCGKTFHRKDLLERHQHRHEQESRMSPMSSGGQPGQSYSQSMQEPPTTLSPVAPGGYRPPIPISSAPWVADADSEMQHPAPQEYMNPYGPGVPGYVPGAGWPEGQGMGSVPPPMNFPPGPGTWNNDRAPRTMSTSMLYYPTAPGTACEYPVDLCGMPLAADPGHFDTHHHANSTVRSLPPLLVEGQSPETLDIALAALSPCAVATTPLFSTCGSESGQMTGLFAAHVFAPVSLSRKVQSAIPAYLEVYWDRTYPVYPYIHKASFGGLFDGEATPFELLKCAMAALATQFLDDKAHRIAGSELHAFACQELKTFTEGKHWSLPIMQAVVCCEYYARFRGRDKQSYKPSSNYRKVYEMSGFCHFPHIGLLAKTPNSQLVEKHHTFSLPLLVLGNKLLSWKDWVETETRRRLLATCFMLDVHTSAYFKEPPILALGPDHPSLPMNQVPFSTNTNPLWECPDWESWSRLVDSDPSLGIPFGRTLADEFTPQDVATMSGFDATILMTGYASQLAGSGEMDAGEAFSSPSSPASRLAKLFPASGVAQAYLAIHFTPLHALLSVSGNSWVLNRKVPGPNEFREHKQTLDKWCQSESAAVAVSWAARALLVFLRIRAKTRRTSEAGSSSSDVDSSAPPRGSRARWRDVSDYWGVYVCALICWAFGREAGDQHRAYDGEGTTAHNEASRSEAARWILEAAQRRPEQLLKWRKRRCVRGVVCLARDILSPDCLANRSMLYSDAVSVLKRLGEPSA